ncbi:MAG TPA: GNAT family N-acetyltransferase, partial [Polyangiaceae bacterium]|nr:GNAT family N-acetyltransferase [Polyangiaceae bacterium]
GRPSLADSTSSAPRVDLEVRAVARADAAGLAALFDAASSTCFCRYWHFEGDKNAWLERSALEPETSRGELEAALTARSDEAAGLVALAAGAVVGWLKLSRATTVPKLYEQRLYRGLSCFGGPRDGIVTIGCVLVAPTERRRGVATRLVEGAIAHAREAGARAIEALPRRPREAVSPEELFMGPWSTLVRRGFVEVGGEGPYPVLRLELEGVRAPG